MDNLNEQETIEINGPVEKNLDFTIEKSPLLKEYMERLTNKFSNHKPALEFNGHLGSGSFGDVFRAGVNYDCCSEIMARYNNLEEIAIKIMSPALLNTEDPMDLKEYKKRFSKECVLQSSLSKQLPDKIVQVYDFGEFGEYRFMATELMNDMSLRNIINPKKDKRNPKEYLVKDRISMMKDISYILKSIHDRGFVHRDIKPENILFSKGTYVVNNKDTSTFEGERIIKLTDFGLVRWVAPHTSEEESSIVGSPNYMSPEQIKNPDQADRRTDIFSFGVVCYELVNGEYPRKVGLDNQLQDSRKKYLSRLAETKPKPIDDINDIVNEDLNDIILKCMDMDPDRRYFSMDHVIHDLESHYNSTFGKDVQ